MYNPFQILANLGHSWEPRFGLPFQAFNSRTQGLPLQGGIQHSVAQRTIQHPA
jgi:hypothetical protein